ncbi:hypothetical protein BV898_19334 [Hypsibius exemplaris]|uniref:Uncharacterized protein n=1 Tax=Hypsibius exemplaris TaxID=2072580 RepID=A0A9X6NJD7_HYPEX|nr:hypothetical protein BV898_19334 [Hypsibius exemplaris]
MCRIVEQGKRWLRAEAPRLVSGTAAAGDFCGVLRDPVGATIIVSSYTVGLRYLRQTSVVISMAHYRFGRERHVYGQVPSAEEILTPHRLSGQLADLLLNLNRLKG